MASRVVGLDERFWSKVDRSHPDGCWPFTGSRHPDGYGNFKIDGQSVHAHRVAWLLTHGHWPDQQVLHRCDYPACCNPQHLFEGTHTENMLDAKRKGRINPWGIKKLTLSDVLVIHELSELGERQQDIGRYFGVHQSHVSQIVRRVIWSHA